MFDDIVGGISGAFESATDFVAGLAGDVVETALPVVGGLLFPGGAIVGQLLADPASKLVTEGLDALCPPLFPPRPRPCPWTPPCDPGGPGGPVGNTLMEKLIALIGQLEKKFEDFVNNFPEKPTQQQMADLKLQSDTFNQNVQLAMGVIDANGKLNSSIAQKIGANA